MVSTLSEQQYSSSPENQNDERFINAIIEEREPGVYVRSQNPNRELDFLWENGQTKRVYDNSRNTIGYFLAGTVTGAVITLVLCLAVLSINHFLSGPKEQVVTDANVNAAEEIALPIKEETAAETTKTEKVTEPVAVNTPTTEVKKPVETPTEAVTAVKPTAAVTQTTTRKTTTTSSASKTHAVQNGETIGSIAFEYYGDAGPNMVEKIQRANNLKNVHSIQIGQKLVIPAKD